MDLLFSFCDFALLDYAKSPYSKNITFYYIAF